MSSQNHEEKSKMKRFGVVLVTGLGLLVQNALAQPLPEVTKRANSVIAQNNVTQSKDDLSRSYRESGEKIGEYSIRYVVHKISIEPQFNPHYDILSTIVEGPNNFYVAFSDLRSDGPSSGDELYVKEGGTGTNLPEMFLIATLTDSSLKQRLGYKTRTMIEGNPQIKEFKRPGALIEATIERTFGLQSLYSMLLNTKDSWGNQYLIRKGAEHLRSVMYEFVEQHQ